MLTLRFTNPPSDQEQNVYLDIEKKIIENIEGMLSSSVVYDNGMFYFALYFIRNLKVTFDYSVNDTNIMVTFIDAASNEIIRMETFDNIDDIIKVISAITNKLLNSTVDETNNQTATDETFDQNITNE